MRIAVVGSRGVVEEKYVITAIGDYINDLSQYTSAITIISGGAEGVDSYAKSFANDHGYDFISFVPIFKLSKGIPFSMEHFFVRNRQIVDNSDAVIAVWDGESRGTAYTIEYANRRGKDVRIYKV